MLAGVLVQHEGALRASLWSEYGIRLVWGGHGRTEPPTNPLELADLVEHLPPACALSRVLGGPGALSDAAIMAREVEFTIRSAMHAITKSTGPKPEKIPLPKPAHEVRAEEQVQSAKARAWQARQNRTQPSV